MLTESEALSAVSRHLGASPRAVHSVLVGAIMRRLAQFLGADRFVWELTGLCHDLDFEATRDDPARHGLLAAEWLGGKLPPDALDAIRAHDHRTGFGADTSLAHALKLADTLAVIRDQLGEAAGAILASPDAEPRLATAFPTRPYLPSLLLGSAARLAVPLGLLAAIASERPLALIHLTPAAPGFAELVAESRSDGHNMLTRLAENWQSGANRFDKPGEVLLGAYLGARLVGICGRNIDPYDASPRAGRVRHLYVALAVRRQNIGRALVEAVASDAGHCFDHLNTNAPTKAFGFYERLGFSPISAPHITHRFQLTAG